MKHLFKKTLSLILVILMLTSLTSALTLTSAAANTYDPAKVVELAQSYVGTNWKNSACLNFVATMFQKAYGTAYNSAPCAYEYGKKFIDSTSMDNIPIGADVFFSGSNVTCGKHTAGHVGIYIGDGYMIHTWSGKVKKDKVIDIHNKNSYDYMGWGWHGNMTFTTDTPSTDSSANSLKTNTYYTLTNAKSGKLLNVYGSKSASNTNVTIYQKDGTSGQAFKFVSHGTTKYNGKTYTKYIIIAKCASSCALNVYGTSAKNGANVNIWKKSGNSTQDWIFEAVNGGYVIRSANNPNFVLTASGTANSTNVKLATYSSGNTYQIWKLS